VTWVKICATTNPLDARASVAAGADALGFIFAPSTRRIEANAAAEIVVALPAEVEKIGVFVNETPERVAEIAGQVGLTGVQLHGDEPASQLTDYRGKLGGRKLIKTLQVGELLAHCDGRQLQAYLEAHASIDGILLDAGRPSQRGGTGVPFDWEAAQPIAQRIKAVLPVIIAGGLTADNVTEAVRLFDPYGVDVVSGVEREVGKKDDAKLRSFVAAAREYAASSPKL
jgi:phosphoribosylanthranilate isomerase